MSDLKEMYVCYPSIQKMMKIPTNKTKTKEFVTAMKKLEFGV
jgi:hypothetical protein